MTMTGKTGSTDAPTLVHGVSFNPRDRSVRAFDREDLDRELNDPEVFSWIDVQASDIAALNDVLRRSEMDLVLRSHFDDPETLPRVVERSDCLAFYLHEVEEPERHMETAQGLSELRVARMILVLGADYVITFHREPLDAVDYVKAGCAESFRVAGRTPGFIAFLFLQRCLADFALLNLANDNFLDLLNRSPIENTREQLNDDIATAGRNILTLKMLTASLQVVLMLVATKRNPFVSDEARQFFTEMLASSQELRASVDSSRDLLDGIVANIHAAATGRTNEIARILTVMSGILLPLTVLTGIYGMNFENMPELKHPLGYYGVLAAMTVVVTGLLTLFWRRGWLGRPARRSRRSPGFPSANMR